MSFVEDLFSRLVLVYLCDAEAQDGQAGYIRHSDFVFEMR